MLPIFKPVFPVWLRPSRLFRWGLVVLLCGLLGPFALAAKKKEIVHLPVFKPETPFESIRQASETAGMTMSGYAPLANHAGMRLGDSVTVLLSLHDGRKHQQWILELVVTEVTPEEIARPLDEVKRYSSTGHEYVFSGGRSALTMRMIGPLEESDEGKSQAMSPKIAKRRILVSSDFQTLGLQGVPGYSLRLRDLQKADPDYRAREVNFSAQPFSDEAIASAQRGEGHPLTKAEERAFVGGFIALREIVITVSRTPGLDDIMMKVVDVPWWALIRSLGKVHLNIGSLDAYQKLKTQNTRLSPEGTVYTWPNKLSINGHEAAVFKLLIVEPKAPLGVMAGVIGLAAGHLDGKGPVLTGRIISTRVASSESDDE